jgi:hypothetical protein
MMPTPSSSSIEAYGYDELGLILYVKYNSGETTYSFVNVGKDVFEGLQKAESKGKFITKVKKDVFERLQKAESNDIKEKKK